jgi:hypothetical protein
MYARKSFKIQGNLCIEFYAQKCERNSIRGRRIFIGFPDKFAKPAFYAGLVRLDFTGDNRRGAPQRSNQCGNCYSTQNSVHKSGFSGPQIVCGPSWIANRTATHRTIFLFGTLATPSLPSPRHW